MSQVEIEELSELLHDLVLERGNLFVEDKYKNIQIIDVDITSYSLRTYVLMYNGKYYRCNINYDSYDQYINCEDIFEVEPISKYITVYEPVS